MLYQLSIVYVHPFFMEVENNKFNSIQNGEISARSLRSLVIVYEISQISHLFS